MWTHAEERSGTTEPMLARSRPSWREDDAMLKKRGAVTTQSYDDISKETHNMNTSRRSFLAAGAALLGSTLLGTQAHAQSSGYPNKPITIVVPFGAGSTTDQVARFLSPYLSTELKQPVVIDNKAGASGSIGMQFAVRQPADGYTFVLGTNTTHAANVSLFKQLPYDPVKDFTPISNLIIGGVVLVVR